MSSRVWSRAFVCLYIVVVLVACGKGTGVVGSKPLPGRSAASPSPTVPQTQDADWHALAVSQRNLNAALQAPHHAAIKVGPQAQVDLGSKAISALAPGLRSIPFPHPTQAMGQRSASIFTDDQLIHDGSEFDATQPLSAVTTQPNVKAATFNCSSNPYKLQFDKCAYAMYRFNLPNAGTQSIAQTVGVLWSDDQSPTAYWIGLTNWNLNHWDWFQGGNDNVVTVPTLDTYCRGGDGLLYVVVIVADSGPRGLELVQVGAKETRGLGGARVAATESLDYTAPELYYPGKTPSFLSSYTLPQVLDRLGFPYDQGDSLMCTCCAVAGAENYELSRNYSPLWFPIFANRRISPKWLYRNTDFGLCNTGRPPEHVMDFMENTGGAMEEWSPFNTNCDNDWDTPTTDANRPYLKPDGWRKIRSKGQEGIDEVKQYLSDWERPVVCLVTADDNLLQGDFSNDAVWTWNDWVPNILNWHTMLIIGWDDSRNAFLVRNSWGLDWGTDGNCWVSYDTFTGRCWIDCFVMWDDYDDAVADWFGVNSLTAAKPPANFTTSEGTWSDHVSLSWDSVPNASSYEIYRDDPSTPLATVSVGTTTYDDNQVFDHDQHTYWLRTTVGTSTGDYTNPRGGWIKNPAPPTIQDIYLSPDGKAKQDASGQFTSVAYNPTGGGALSFSWDFPAASIHEATPITDPVPVVTFNQPGSYDVTLTLNNSYGQTQKTYHYDVLAPPQWPVGALTGPAQGTKNRIVNFDASTSTCESGQTISDYYWDYDGDGYYEDHTTSPKVGYIYRTAGTFNPSVWVVDSRGLGSGWSVPSPVTILNYDEVESNDVCSWGRTMTKQRSYSGSIGTYAGAYDGGTVDWWIIPYHAGYTHYVKVQYDTAKITQLTLLVWGDSFSYSQQDVCTDGLAEVNFPSAQPFSLLYVQISVTGVGGSDYTVYFDRPGEL